MAAPKPGAHWRRRKRRFPAPRPPFPSARADIRRCCTLVVGTAIILTIVGPVNYRQSRTQVPAPNAPGARNLESQQPQVAVQNDPDGLRKTQVSHRNDADCYDRCRCRCEDICIIHTPWGLVAMTVALAIVKADLRVSCSTLGAAWITSSSIVSLCVALYGFRVSSWKGATLLSRSLIPTELAAWWRYILNGYPVVVEKLEDEENWAMLAAIHILSIAAGLYELRLLIHETTTDRQHS
ncbi:unnamed protein product [Ostreobium quekettii]|uniref:Transmembrane protein n=1 Tax=Ostreobium quekettii TaxID=121088 RepID=A0A8S1JC79_9CHLO|nr:unnamed protein product [Ostreobium quekettii]